MSHNTLMALVKYLQKTRPGIIEKATFEGTEEGRGVIPLNSGAREMAAILDTGDVNICEEILMKSKNHSALLELFKSNSMHHEALQLLKQLLEESKSNQSQTDVTQMFSPELIVEYLNAASLQD
ncbi:Vacuolar sorting protein 39 [Raphanus sativus]|nr:Vacuolar sorting protein 39 [Raphanus sativus]